MKLNENSKALLRVTLFSLIVIIIALCAGQTAVFRTIERLMVDLRFRLRGSAEIDPKISLVLVDSTAMDRYGYPVPRQFYARVVRSLCDNGVGAVVIDRTFESLERSGREAGMDELAFALKRYRDRVISAWHSPIIESTFSADPPVAPVRFALEQDAHNVEISPFHTSIEPERVSLPYYDALQSLKWLGAVPVEKASGNRIEKIPLVIRHGDRIYPSISLLSACVALKVDPSEITIGKREISIPAAGGDIVIPIDDRGQITVNYTGGRNAFLQSAHSLARVYDSILSDDSLLPPEFFRDKIVLIGNDDVMGSDMHTTPFDKDLIPGVAIHANVVSNILQRQFIDTAPLYINLLILIVLVSCISFVQKMLSPRTSLICLTALLAILWFAAAQCFQFGGILINVSYPMFGGILAFSSTTFYNYVAERRRVGHIKQIFGKHVSQQIMDRIVLEKDGQVPMTQREVTALFVDITDHSRWARHLEPFRFARELNECLEAMAQAVFANGGTINIFLGDGLLAIYNAPVEQEDHPLRAVKTGLDIQENISRLNEKRIAEGVHPVAVRVGINTGKAMAGTLGSKERLEYTVVGDTINMASRTEGECEPGRVAVTEAVADKIAGEVELEPIGLRRVKGREDGLMLYHVVRIGGEDGSLKDEATIQTSADSQVVLSSRSRS